MEEKSSKRVLIQAMYSSGKLKTLSVDRIRLKLIESKALLKSMSIRRPGLSKVLAWWKMS